jgi:hypothetical protein
LIGREKVRIARIVPDLDTNRIDAVASQQQQTVVRYAVLIEFRTVRLQFEQRRYVRAFCKAIATARGLQFGRERRCAERCTGAGCRRRRCEPAEHFSSVHLSSSIY